MRTMRMNKRLVTALAAATVVSVGAAVAVVMTAQSAQAAFEAPVAMEQTSDWKKTGWRSEREQTRCPVDTLVVGVKIDPVEGLQLGENHVKCASPAVAEERGVVVRPTGTPTKSVWIDEGDPEPVTFDCGNAAMIATTHLGTYTKGETQYRCAVLQAESAVLGTAAHIVVTSSEWSDWIDAAHWNDGTLQTSFEYVCPAGSAMAGREHAHTGYGKVRFLCNTWEVRARS
ncbi:hypothetical protein [Curtobacterium sp. USHLN213]|uniref:hypothetical protein n=1 Tax=Curtobacterium sp. USHLN213 TaxID=3081255 RepID=UPI00301590AD